MEISKVVQILKKLPDDVGLRYPENWDNNSGQWCKDAVEAVETAVKILEASKVVGTLTVNGTVYAVTSI